jgi:hypothetical protein
MVDNSSVVTSMTQYANSLNVYSAVARSVLEDKLSNFRVVAVGYEIRNLIN